MYDRSTHTIERISLKTEKSPTTTNNLAGVVLDLAKKAIDFAYIERVPRYPDSRRENNAEHSFMLALIAPELARALDNGLDLGLVHQYSTVHDLIELRTGDVATFLLSPEALAKKESVEQQALPDFLESLPPYTRDLVEAYERQEEPESRFVRAVDKLLPVLVDILGDGDRVMREDYNVHTVNALCASQARLSDSIKRRFGDFPEVVAIHRLLCDLYEIETKLPEANTDQ